MAMLVFWEEYFEAIAGRHFVSGNSTTILRIGETLPRVDLNLAGLRDTSGYIVCEKRYHLTAEIHF
jgi:hypothetical protein